jgi:hypothetical protein
MLKKPLTAPFVKLGVGHKGLKPKVAKKKLMFLTLRS